MTAETTERWADWCTSGDGFAMSGTRMKEHSRESMGDRWCFHHRRRHEFFWVVMAPDGLSYYGPHVEVHGETRDCTDLFPGWTRTWEED
ncbi:hypothetical protein [Pseudactinotalea sp. Z1732]|uniref:hypothetical protein n=1 Tax=Micrococcales TaxID=85006 RepID=UPI003C7CB006